MLSKDYFFDSEQLRFRGIQEKDADLIVLWRSNPDNFKNFITAKPITKDDHLRWFANYLNDETRYDFLIIDLEGLPIGTCGLSNITGDSCEISYMIGNPDARGKGFAIEAIQALSDVAFRELGVSFIDARILAHNIASRKAAEKSAYLENEVVYRRYKN